MNRYKAGPLAALLLALLALAAAPASARPSCCASPTSTATGRLLLRRRPVDGRRRGRHREAPDRPPRPGAVPQVLARRPVDRLHRPVRRRRAGLRHPGRAAACRKQLTYYPARGPLPPRWGYDNQVYGWTPDGKRGAVPLDARRLGPDRHAAVHRAGRRRPARARCRCRSPGAGDFSPDGKQVVYSPLFRDFRTWKRYQGGWAQDLYIFDLATPRR